MWYLLDGDVMKNLSFATIYLKTIASDIIYDFIPIEVVIGVLENNTFQSVDGKIYEPVRTCKKYGFENATKISEWASKNERKELYEMFKDYAHVCKKIYFLYLKDNNLLIRYHEAMLTYGIGQLRGLEEVKKKSRINPIDKKEKIEYTENGANQNERSI